MGRRIKFFLEFGVYEAWKMITDGIRAAQVSLFALEITYAWDHLRVIM